MTRPRGKTTKRLVFSMPIDLFNKIECQIREDMTKRSKVYSRRLNYGVGCYLSGCSEFMEMLRANTQYAKANPDNMKTVCITVSDSLHADIVDCAGDRSLSRFCNTLLECLSCEHAGNCDLCKKEISSMHNSQNDNQVKKSDARKDLNEIVEWANNRCAEIEQKINQNIQNEVDYVFGGKPIRPESKQDKVNNDEN